MSDPTAQVAEVTDDESPAPPREAARRPGDTPALVEQDLLVEDVSIDGMCGVY